MTTSVILYAGLVAAVAAERVAELVVSRRNVRWALERGGVETGQEHYPVMVALHVSLLGGCLAEVVVLDRAFDPWLGSLMILFVVGAQGLRWWCISTLGRQWSTRVVVVPGLPRVAAGPYRWLRHPNYAAVAVEGVALPLVHSAWLTAAIFTVVNILVLRVRVAEENRALAALAPAP